jgi:hypothetical protein
MSKFGGDTKREMRNGHSMQPLERNLSIRGLVTRMGHSEGACPLVNYYIAPT